MSTCLLRTFFDFIEGAPPARPPCSGTSAKQVWVCAGLPEGHHWNIHEDVAFLQMRCGDQKKENRVYSLTEETGASLLTCWASGW